MNTNNNISCIYFIHFGDKFKIGKSVNFYNRFNMLMDEWGPNIDFEKSWIVINETNNNHLEKFYHTLFKKYKIECNEKKPGYSKIYDPNYYKWYLEKIQENIEDDQEIVFLKNIDKYYETQLWSKIDELKLETRKLKRERDKQLKFIEENKSILKMVKQRGKYLKQMKEISKSLKREQTKLILENSDLKTEKYKLEEQIVKHKSTLDNNNSDYLESINNLLSLDEEYYNKTQRKIIFNSYIEKSIFQYIIEKIKQYKGKFVKDQKSWIITTTNFQKLIEDLKNP